MVNTVTGLISKNQRNLTGWQLSICDLCSVYFVFFVIGYNWYLCKLYNHITQLTTYSLFSKIYFYIQLHLLLPLLLLWLHAPFTSTFASSPFTSTFDRSPLRKHIPQVDIHSHISHILIYSHSSQSSFCHFYSNTPQIYSHIPQMTWSIPVSEKGHTEIFPSTATFPRSLNTAVFQGHFYSHIYNKVSLYSHISHIPIYSFSSMCIFSMLLSSVIF